MKAILRPVLAAAAAAALLIGFNASSASAEPHSGQDNCTASWGYTFPSGIHVDVSTNWDNYSTTNKNGTFDYGVITSVQPIDIGAYAIYRGPTLSGVSGPNTDYLYKGIVGGKRTWLLNVPPAGYVNSAVNINMNIGDPGNRPSQVSQGTMLAAEYAVCG